MTQPMQSTWRFLRREPLAQFFLLAGLIFGADRFLHPPEDTSRVIVVSRALRERMSANFDEDRERRATPAELNAMVENWVANEILYREGKALGVDRGDDTIRDRIAFKLQLLIFSKLDAPAVSRAELQAWFEDNRQRFDEPERVSFYLGPPGDEATARAQLAAINAEADAKALEADTRAVIGRPVPSLAASFGEPFRDALLALPIESWSMLRSTEGWHVVRLDSRRPAVPAAFADVEDDAMRQYQVEAVRQRAWEAVKRLRTTYTVRYES